MFHFSTAQNNYYFDLISMCKKFFCLSYIYLNIIIKLSIVNIITATKKSFLVTLISSPGIGVILLIYNVEQQNQFLMLALGLISTTLLWLMGVYVTRHPIRSELHLLINSIFLKVRKIMMHCRASHK